MTHGSRADGMLCSCSSVKVCLVPVSFMSTTGVAPVTNRTIDAAVETWSVAVGGMADYWGAAFSEGRTPADLSLDSMRWWRLMADRRPPQWASRHRIVRSSPLTISSCSA